MLNPYLKSSLKLKKPVELVPTAKPSILKVFEKYVEGDHRLRSSGRATITNCPFHADQKPSFAIYEDNNTFYCFSCGATGDSFSLIMELLHVDFKQAVEISKTI